LAEKSRWRRRPVDDGQTPKNREISRAVPAPAAAQASHPSLSDAKFDGRLLRIGSKSPAHKAAFGRKQALDRLAGVMMPERPEGLYEARRPA
jgi:hypothetical protein